MRYGKTLCVLLALLLLLGCQQLRLASVESGEEIQASGTIEAEEIAVASELGGRVVEVLVDEGDEVEEGQVLIRLDDSVVRSQLEEAKAAVEAARAGLAKLEAGARPEEVQAARAALAQAVAQRDGAKEAWEDALKSLREQQELQVQIEQARAQVEQAEREIARAEAQLRTAQIMRDRYASGGSEEERTLYEVYSYQVAAAEAALKAAQARKEAAEQALADLLAKKENPLELKAQVHRAEAQYRQAEAAVKAAQAALDKLLAGARPEELEVAQAQVEQAEAALEALELQLDKHVIRAPASGWVSSCAVDPGESVLPGTTLMVIAYLDEVNLTVYVPETDLGKVHLGQQVEVRVDSFPGEVFKGQVVYISPRAEFTPKNVQTKEERVNLVFAVKVRLPNPEHKLKPGMPADAVIKG